MKTDPAHTKPITGKSYSGNSPKPYYIVQRATETFGPCGIGWGFRIVEEKLLQGAKLSEGFYEQIHMARVAVWYEWNGKRGEVEHVGQTVFSGTRASGKAFTDEDAPKKSVTDALIKALSMIGFAGDIFIGLFDDSKYVNDLKSEVKERASQPNADDVAREKANSEKADKIVIRALEVLSPMDAYQMAEWHKANPEAVTRFIWVKENFPTKWAEVQGLGYDVGTGNE